MKYERTSKEDLIKALSGAFSVDEGQAKEADYKFEEIVISNEHCNRLVDIKTSVMKARSMSTEMLAINALSKFLQSCNSQESRLADTKFRELCKMSESDDILFDKLFSLSKDVTDRMRSLAPDSPQRALLAVYTDNCLNQMLKEYKTE